jgi:hypothetical protein
MLCTTKKRAKLGRPGRPTPLAEYKICFRPLDCKIADAIGLTIDLHHVFI